MEELNTAILNGDLDGLKSKAKTTSVKGKRKKDGVVYTPDNITQFIVVNTLGVHIDEQFEILFSEYGQYKKDGTIQWKKGKQTELKFWYAWQERLKEIKVVDPACGSGAFLVAAFDYLYIEYEKINNHIEELTGQRGILELNKEILNKNLFGVDINEESIEITKLSLWLKTAERGKPLESLDDNFKTGNSLGFESATPDSNFYWKKEFNDILSTGGFDVVLGNPPYVRQELLGHIKPWLETNYSVFNGTLDLYGYFFELSYNLLKSNGRMAFISSATFFKTSSGKSLRTYLSNKYSIDSIVDFGHVQVFEGVTTYPAIFSLKKNNPTKEHKFKHILIKDKLPNDLQSEFNLNNISINQSILNEELWNFEGNTQLLILDKLSKNNRTLKQVFNSPYRGVVTGCNEIFIINAETRKRLVDEHLPAAEIIKPLLEGKDITKWGFKSRDIFLIFTKRGIDIDKFPSIKRYLESYKPRLEPKPKDWPNSQKWQGRKAGPYKWYEIQDAVAYYQEFEKPKVMWGNLQNKAGFSYDVKNYYINAPSPILAHEKAFILLALLNSNVCWYQLINTAIGRSGGYIECKPVYIDKIRVPEIVDSLKLEELSKTLVEKATIRINVESGYIRRLKDLCPENEIFKPNKKLENWWLLDFTELQKEIKKSFKGVIKLSERNDWQDYFEVEKLKRESLNNEVILLQNKLDQEVYELFNLTEDEIKIIEKECL